ncbi:hypothetical protein [Hydrogenophaga sp.]|uniref:hypothetical protein n=1 Tax=Hydrogenophaga sp. TaxID=1904254 RepID=UPI0025B8FF3C|nr:hypothetical protein [Hydrogenophaga sp.]MBT9463538.1 hypothetical protein [Hydrogenophaga sp.]
MLIRISISPDGSGSQDYLKGINPAGLNMEVLHLIQLGYQIRMTMSRIGLKHLGHMPTSAPVQVPTPQLSSTPSADSETAQVDVAGPLEEGASVASPFDASFKSMFGQAFEHTRNRKAVA